MQIVLLIPTARQECVSEWEWMYVVCMVNVSPSGRWTDWCSVQLRLQCVENIQVWLVP